MLNGKYETTSHSKLRGLGFLKTDLEKGQDYGGNIPEKTLSIKRTEEASELKK